MPTTDQDDRAHLPVRVACDCPCGMVGCSACPTWWGYSLADHAAHQIAEAAR